MQNPAGFKAAPCYHCGEDCEADILQDEHHFCCEGCRQVFLLLNENNLCTYYNLYKNPGIKAKGKFRSERFAYLDDGDMAKRLVMFSSDTQVNVSFSIPQMHCSSCIYLLENLHRLEPGVIRSQVDFQRKEVFIVFDPRSVTLRRIVELMAFIGYEPYISLQDNTKKHAAVYKRTKIYRIGVAGFCFANIMMLSFPEYFSSGKIEQGGLRETFTWLNFGLSLPVLFYSASGFFTAAWKGLRQRYLNIDAPIALAILVTYGRSYYEIISGHGAGYLDSGTGIVFFMLAGRWFQDKTYSSLAFDRDYRSYFPLGVTVIRNGTEQNIPVTKLQKGEHMIIRNEEMIPADAVLLTGDARIDYSFVSGEHIPVSKQKGELIYAGGKQMGSVIELAVLNEASQSYITRLWNNDVFTAKKNTRASFIHPWSRYFTGVLFVIAFATAGYWWMNNPAKLLPAVTAILIVACPCSLLLSATFTFGNMLRIFGKNKCYLKHAGVIESLANIGQVVFDKTGTLTQGHVSRVSYEGCPLSAKEMLSVKQIVRQSSHPLSKVIASWLPAGVDNAIPALQFREYPGLGMEARVNDIMVKLGSAAYLNRLEPGLVSYDTGSHVHVMVNDVHMGRFSINNHYREGMEDMVGRLKEQQYITHVLSGDNAAELENIRCMFGEGTVIRFRQTPQEKLEYIRSIQQDHTRVLMLGDGLNDAGALMQSDVGIAVSDNSARFTPACDAILDGEKLNMLDKFLSYARSGKKIVLASFIFSILYNLVGIFFAVQGLLSPMVAAILMPISSISIVLLVTLLSTLSARYRGLLVQND